MNNSEAQVENQHQKDSSGSGANIIPEMTRSIIKDLIENKVECMVCSEDISYKSEIWSCSTCFSILHIKCIYDWIFKLNTNNKSDVMKFTCPHCSCIYSVTADNLPVYNCFCEKYNKSTYIDKKSILIPHTCGKTCDYDICEHLKCSLPCHPGPHLACKVKCETECYCGKERKEVPCNILRTKVLNKEGKFTCSSICGKSLLCGNHSCTFKCHDGECPGNQVLDTATGKTNNCENCLKESEEKIVRIIEEIEFIAKECRIDIKLVTSISDLLFRGQYPCKKHFMDEISIENNLKNFLSILKLSGDNFLINLREFIPLCKRKEKNSCQCGSTSNPGTCYLINYPSDLIDYLNKDSNELFLHPKKHQENSNKNEDISQIEVITTKSLKHKKVEKIVSCNKPCKTLKSCKVHTCTQICCSMRGKEVKSISQDPEGKHLCFLKCGKTLECGRHECIDNCHRGECLPCYNIIRDEKLVCDCGSYSLDPPFKCSQLPDCNNPCLKPKKCAHGCKQKCHRGECIPCKELVTKLCVCEENLLKDVVCSEPAHCQKKCGEILPCGAHFCEETCHTHIENPNFFCTITCGRTMLCNHACKAQCHGEEECKYYSCNVQTKATCNCGVNSKLMKCSEIQQINKKNLKKNNETKNDETKIDEIEYTHSVKILECNKECTQKARLKIIEESFKGLKNYSDEQNKSFFKTKPVFTDDPNSVQMNFSNLCQLKFTSNMIRFAKKKPKTISNLEKMIENYLANITNPPTGLFQCEKKYASALIDLMTNIYNLKMRKTSKQDGTFYISIESAATARLPRFRLSLFGLLFKHTKFIKPEYNDPAIEKYRIYHPFEQSFIIKNYRLSCHSEDIEYHLISNKIVDSEDDFYLDEPESQLCYVHFFKAEKCLKAFNLNTKFCSQFQDCYLIDQYAGYIEKCNDKSVVEVVGEKNASVYEMSSDFSQKLYSYKDNLNYFILLDEFYDSCKKNTEGKSKIENVKSDNEGFTKVSNKKK